MRYGVIVIALAAAAPAYAGAGEADRTHRKCVAELMDGDFTLEGAMRLCKPGARVKPPRTGWHCRLGRDDEPLFSRAPGGTRLRRDAVCDEGGR